MQINHVSAGYSDPATLGKSADSAEAAGTLKIAVAESNVPTADARTAALREILAKYDVTDISPDEFSEMIQKLYESGAISESELQQLAAIRLDLAAEDLDPDSSIDMLEFYAEKVLKLQRRYDDGDGPPTQDRQLGPVLRRLDWIEKFALVQSNPEGIGLDTVI